MEKSTQTIAALLEEERTFPPPEEFKKHAHVHDPKIYEKAAKNPEAFWAEAAEELDWFQKSTTPRLKLGACPRPASWAGLRGRLTAAHRPGGRYNST